MVGESNRRPQEALLNTNHGEGAAPKSLSFILGLVSYGLAKPPMWRHYQCPALLLGKILLRRPSQGGPTALYDRAGLPRTQGPPLSLH